MCVQIRKKESCERMVERTARERERERGTCRRRSSQGKKKRETREREDKVPLWLDLW